MNEDQRKHLEFIQNVITRMNSNSFQLKGLAITLATALLAVYASTPKVILLCLPVVPTLIFWFLDSYFLQLERKFRGIYNDVVGLKKVNQVKLYEMPVHKYVKTADKQFGYWNVFWSGTIAGFYCSMVVLLIIIGVIIYNKNMFM